MILDKVNNLVKIEFNSVSLLSRWRVVSLKMKGRKIDLIGNSIAEFAAYISLLS